MKREVLLEMSKTELDEYAQVVGVDVTGKKTVVQKVDTIEKCRGRTADVDALGIALTVPIKRMRDKRVSDLMSKRPMTDDDAGNLLLLLLGQEQMDKVVDRVTDDDGTVDVDAMGLVMARVLSSEELKNF